MKRKFIIVITIVSSAIFFGVLFFGTFYSPNGEVSSASPELTKIADEQSKIINASTLSIPSINVEADIQEVGFTRKGNIASPKNFDDVGWYKYGPVPGEEGTAVIDGHVDNGLAFPAVFSNLKDIQYGDDIYVNTKDKKLHFKVQSIDVYKYNSPTNSLLVKSKASRLLLITCTGTWIPEIKTHDKRLVVTATLQSD